LSRIVLHFQIYLYDLMMLLHNLINKLSNSMWKFLRSQERVPHLVKSPAFRGIWSFLPLVPLLSQINVVLTLMSNVFNVDFNIILPSVPMSSNVLLDLVPPWKHFIHFSLSFPYMYHMPCPAHLPRFDHMNNICSGLQTMKLITHFSPVTPHSYLFGRQRYRQQMCGQAN